MPRHEKKGASTRRKARCESSAGFPQKKWARSEDRPRPGPLDHLCRRFLPVQAYRELHDARIAGKIVDGSNAAAAGVTAGLAKQCMVGHVEDLPASFDIPLFMDGDVLHECGIEDT